MKVKFSNVGRDRKSWEVEVPDDDPVPAMIKSIKKNRALASRFIDFDEDEVGKGIVLVGGFRRVGQFEVIE